MDLDKFNYSYNLEQIGGRILPTEEFTKLIIKKIIDQLFNLLSKIYYFIQVMVKMVKMV